MRGIQTDGSPYCVDVPTCPADQYAVGDLKPNGKPNCKTAKEILGESGVKCPVLPDQPPQALRGFNPDGSPDCKPVEFECVQAWGHGTNLSCPAGAGYKMTGCMASDPTEEDDNDVSVKTDTSCQSDVVAGGDMSGYCCRIKP